MKTLFILLALVSQVALADCNIRQASQLVSERKVGNIDDLVKTKGAQSCNVKFSVVVDGEKHNINWTHEDYGDPELSCQKAIDNGMKELFLRLGGKYQTEAITTCTEGKAQPKMGRWKKGDEALENEFGVDPNRKWYFKYQSNTCRFYRERYDGKTFKGVICQNDNQLWTVLDKF